MLFEISPSGDIILSANLSEIIELNTINELDILITSNSITLKRKTNTCIFCHSSFNLVKLGQYAICTDCIQLLANSKAGNTIYDIFD